MNRQELVNQVATTLGIRKSAAGDAVDAVFESIAEALHRGDEVRLIPHFGVFYSVEQEARTGRNPRTGEPIDIAAATRVKFRPSSRLKSALNEPRRLVPRHVPQTRAARA